MREIRCSDHGLSINLIYNHIKFLPTIYPLFYKDPMSLTQRIPLSIATLTLAWIFDQLFWEKAPGVSFPIFVLLCLGIGFWFTWRETEGFKLARPPLGSLILLAPVFFFAVMTFLRAEPMTQMVSFGLTLVCMAVLSATWLGGRWWQYNLVDYLNNFLRWLAGILAQPARKRPVADVQPEAQADGLEARRGVLRVSRSVVIGLLLAVPVILIFASLLSQADPIFEQQLNYLFDWLSFEKLAEYIFRIVYILIAAYLLAGVFLYALFNSPAEKVSDGEKPWLPPFLGWIEASTLLACVNLLFVFFVVVQFRYFFGGQANITLQGFTYSEYARRGFGELLAVAFISLVLFLGLSFVTRRETTLTRRVFSGLGILLTLLVGVMLVSAFQRLLLYEAAYGFTRLRAYTHVFMIWLGLLLLAAVILEAAGRLRFFALTVAVAVLGYGLSLPLLNVDGFIVRQNVARTLGGQELDSAYLVDLSHDAVPALFERFRDPLLPQSLRDDLGSILACHTKTSRLYPENAPWPSFQWSLYKAQTLFQQYGGELEIYPLEEGESGGWQVRVGNEWRQCQVDMYMD